MSGTTPTITCEVFADRLMDFLEGDLDGATHAAMEAHARRCAECGALLADLRRVAHEAAELPALSPSHDLWQGIEARLETPVVSMAGRRPRWRPSRLLSLAAAAAVVLAAGLSYRALRHQPAAPAVPTAQVATRPAPNGDTALAPAPTSTQPTTPAATPAPGASTSAATRLAANRAAEATPSAVEQSYDGEIAGLRAIIAKRHNDLDSATVAVLQRNLTVIDSAIAQCKKALAKDPNSRFLMQSLSQSLDTKVQILRMTAALPSTT